MDGCSTHVFLSGSDDGKRNLSANVSNANETRVYKASSVLLRSQRRCQSNRCLLDHRVRNVVRLGQDCSKTNTREDVHVVALSGLVSLAVVLSWLVWASGSKDDGTVCPRNIDVNSSRTIELNSANHLMASS
jgi:hypothetical protein